MERKPGFSGKMRLADLLTTLLHNCLDQANVCFSGLTKVNKCLRKSKVTAKDIEMVLKMMTANMLYMLKNKGYERSYYESIFDLLVLKLFILHS